MNTYTARNLELTIGGARVRLSQFEADLLCGRVREPAPSREPPVLQFTVQLTPVDGCRDCGRNLERHEVGRCGDCDRELGGPG